MNIGILIGNTNTRFAVVEKESIKNIKIFKTKEIAQVLRKYQALHKKDAVFYVASVVPEATRVVKKTFSCVREVSFKDFPFKINVKFPEKVGIDRLLNATGAWKVFKTSCLIIDAGSAITIDLINSNGDFEGGVIFPGQRLIVDSLKSLALLKNIKIPESPNLIGKDTSEAIGSGITFGLGFLVDGYIRELKKNRKKFNIVFTGGTGRLLLDYVKIGPYEENLSFKGLQYIIYGD